MLGLPAVYYTNKVILALARIALISFIMNGKPKFFNEKLCIGVFLVLMSSNMQNYVRIVLFLNFFESSFGFSTMYRNINVSLRSIKINKTCALLGCSQIFGYIKLSLAYRSSKLLA